MGLDKGQWRNAILKAGGAKHTDVDAASERLAAVVARELPVNVPLPSTVPRPSTGTVDDEHESEDERDGGNEASERETKGNTEAPEGS